MRKVISKYSLPSSLTEHDIPVQHVARHVGIFNDRLCVWIEHPADVEMRQNTVKVTFRIYHTDETFEMTDDHKYIGTVLGDRDFDFAYHIYEVRTKSKPIYSDEEQ